jgi:hypothetical protein
MSCFKLPASLCHDLEILIWKFWWSNSSEGNKIHWVNWETMCQAKKKRRMGFRDLKTFNEALLAKQVWRLLHNDDSLLYKVFKSRFFPSGSILEDNVKTNRSYAWKSILQAQSVVKLGSRWRIGNGLSIRIWGDNWLPGSSPSQVISPRNYFPVDAKVSSLIDPIKMEWKECVINHVFLPLEVNLILGIPLSHHPAQDKIIWAHTPTGTFSVRSAYHFLLNNHYGDKPSPSNSSSSSGLWKKIWDLPIPPKIRHFLWRACREALPTKSNLRRQKILVDPVCNECQSSEEDILHVVWNSPVIQQVWHNSPVSNRAHAVRPSSFTDLLISILDSTAEEFQCLFAIQTWLLWFRRNKGRADNEWDEVSSIPLRAS